MPLRQRAPVETEVMRRHIINAVFAKFRIDEGANAFGLGDPVPRGDIARDVPNTWYFEISPLIDGWNGAVDSSRPLNVSSNSNHQICRRVTPGEKPYTRNAGRQRGIRRTHRPAPCADWG